MKSHISVLLAFILIFQSCSQWKENKDKNTETYSNPVSSMSLPDPTVIKTDDSTFYLYATEDTRNMPIMKSHNLVDWTFVGTAFTDSTRPDFEPNGGLWAPDINYINGKYVLYYSMSVWGGEWTCGIGVATADSPEGPFHDRGKIFRSNEIKVQNSIDPFYIEDNGRKYLFWGSFRGIFSVEMSDDGLSLATNSAIRPVAGTAFEGTYIHKKGDFYYFFASVGSCCEGIKSTYRLVVGRSENLMGPYLDKAGKDMMQNGYTLIMDKNERFVGNGHNAEIVTDKEGTDWILYHGVDVEQPEGRKLLLDKIEWDKNGWPKITSNGSPSTVSVKPVF